MEYRANSIPKATTRTIRYRSTQVWSATRIGTSYQLNRFKRAMPCIHVAVHAAVESCLDVRMPLRISAARRYSS